MVDWCVGACLFDLMSLIQFQVNDDISWVCVYVFVQCLRFMTLCWFLPSWLCCVSLRLWCFCVKYVPRVLAGTVVLVVDYLAMIDAGRMRYFDHAYSCFVRRIDDIRFKSNITWIRSNYFTYVVFCLALYQAIVTCIKLCLRHVRFVESVVLPSLCLLLIGLECEQTKEVDQTSSLLCKGRRRYHNMVAPVYLAPDANPPTSPERRACSNRAFLSRIFYQLSSNQAFTFPTNQPSQRSHSSINGSIHPSKDERTNPSISCGQAHRCLVVTGGRD